MMGESIAILLGTPALLRRDATLLVIVYFLKQLSFLFALFRAV